MRILSWLAWSVGLLIHLPLQGQWCCIDTSLQIVDQTTVNLRLLISGAVNNDLSTPNQGVCGVRIKFEHKFIGDLTMDLISPSGQRVRLIGPIGNSGNSSFSKWFVGFVPCSAVAVPDPGFKAKWDNIQSWGILGKFYNGTYYPQNGCLEDFDSGTVNGTWTLSIGDDERFYEGLIESFCILFCEPDGINCEDCSPNGGLFANTALNYCLGDPALANIEQVNFPVFRPDSTLYSYRYIIAQNDQVTEITSKPDLSNAGLGDFLICGISYLTSDSLKLPVIGQLMSLYREQIVLNQNGFCGELSKNCLKISIHPSYTGNVQNISLCSGDSIVVGANSYNQSGSYLVPLASSYGCDSSILLNLEVIDLQIIASETDTLDCMTNSVSIDVSASKLTSNTIIQWSTTNGHFLDLTDSLNPVVDRDGSYKLILSQGNCFDSVQFEVLKKDDIPSLKIIGDSLSCLKNIIQLVASTDADQPKFEWSDGVAQLGFDSILAVNNSGRYYVTVTDRNGCSNNHYFDVFADTITPRLQLNAGVLSCKDSLVSLSFTSDREVVGVIWQGPNSFISTKISPQVNTPGPYQLAVIARNGCIASSTIDVNSFQYTPDYFYQPDTLNCRNKLRFQLQAGSSYVIDSILYTGPSNFTSNLVQPIITDPGLYQVRLKDTAGCLLDTFLVIPIDTKTVALTLSTDLLDCLNDSVRLNLVFQSPDSVNVISIQWSGPPGFDSNLQNPFTREAAMYYVSVMTRNGCISQDSILVLQDAQKPVINLSADTLDCRTSGVVIQTSVNNAIQYEWTGPKGYSSMIEDPVVVDSGTYKLIVTANNGCTSEKSIDIIQNENSPIDSLYSGKINCLNDSATVIIVHSEWVDSVYWTGPNGFANEQDSFKTAIAGSYHVFARGLNGCIDTGTIWVSYDTLPPSILVMADTLNCKEPEAKLTVSSSDSTLLYTWITPNGDTSQTNSLLVNQPGWYVMTARSSNGCTTLDSIEVVDRRANPDYQFIRDSIICSDSIAELSLNSNEIDLKYNWIGPLGFQSPDSAIRVAIPGWYHFTITNAYDCIVSDSFELKEFLKTPKVNFSDSIFNCVTISNPVLTATILDSLEIFEWLKPDGSADINRSIVISEAGNYLFRGEDQYGCLVSKTIMVRFDTLTPSITNVSVGSITCSRTNVIPLIETSPPGVTYSWTGPGAFTSNLPNPLLNQSGLYDVTISSSNLCSVDTSILVVMDTSPPAITAIGGEINCKVDSIQLLVNSQDSLSEVNWIAPGGKLLNGRMPFVNTVGWYQLVAKGTNDCLSRDSVQVTQDLSPPIFKIVSNGIPCVPDSVQIQITTADSVASFLWTGPSGFTSNFQNPFVKDTGQYSVLVTGSNFCRAMDSLSIGFNRNKPFLVVLSDTITCNSSLANLKATFDFFNMKFYWTGANLIDSVQQNLTVAIPGNYNLRVVDTFGCVADTTVSVFIDTTNPGIQIEALDSIVCESKEVRLTNLIKCPACKLQWNTLNGALVTATNEDTVLVRGAGNYSLTIQDSINGCKSFADYLLSEVATPPLRSQLLINPPKCANSNDAEINFVAVLGGNPPFMFSIDGKPYQLINDISNQLAGPHTLSVIDRFGCRWDTLLDIIPPPPLNLFLGSDTTIALGQSYPIIPLTNANTGLLQNILWDPDLDLNCPTCFEVVASPKMTTRYKLKITDENGCKAEDDILISVIEKPKIYLPNAFSPNGDQINDFLSIHSGSETLKVESFQVYDRWGNLIYIKKELEVRGSENLWDGIAADGQKMNPGVFVCMLTLRLANDAIYQLAGEFTLIR